MIEDSKVSPAQAEISSTEKISKIWLIPVVAILVGVWMVYYQISNQGTQITLYFESAEGLEAGKTKIRSRYVDVGRVVSIKLRDDEIGVEISARINPDAEHLLREDSNFWIVTPKVSLSGVTGLSTLLSGPFIELAPGMSDIGQTEFDGLEEPPVTPAGTPGLHITLNSDDEFAYKEGDPIIYKGLKVGQFEDIYFNFEERIVYYNAFIKAPYHELLTSTTRFWDTSGVRFNLTADGLNVHTGNVETLLTNGVAFGIPNGSEMGDLITERAYFDIHESYEDAVSKRYKEAAYYVLLVDDSVRGLRKGAPVEYRGLQVGEVLDINLPNVQQQGLLEETYKIPILISIQPGRVGQPDNAEGVAFVKAQTNLWIDKGLRASLKTGNILTGGQFVDLQNYPNQEQAVNIEFQGHPVIPSVSNEFTQLTQKLGSILDQINALPLEQITDNLNTSLTEFAHTAKELQTTGSQLNALLAKIEEGKLMANIDNTVSAYRTLADSYSQNSQTNKSMNEALLELQSTLRELKPILNRLNKTPNSLVFTTGEDIETIYPKAKN